MASSGDDVAKQSEVVKAMAEDWAIPRDRSLFHAACRGYDLSLPLLEVTLCPVGS
jgi:hypothetical protein